MPREFSPQLRDLLDVVRDFKDGKNGFDELQAAIRRAEESVTEFDLRGLRRHLKGAEGQLELLRFTVEGDELVRAANLIAESAARAVCNALGAEDSQ